MSAASEVTQFDIEVFIEKDVLKFDVSMHNVPFV